MSDLIQKNLGRLSGSQVNSTANDVEAPSTNNIAQPPSDSGGGNPLDVLDTSNSGNPLTQAIGNLATTGASIVDPQTEKSNVVNKVLVTGKQLAQRGVDLLPKPLKEIGNKVLTGTTHIVNELVPQKTQAEVSRIAQDLIGSTLKSGANWLMEHNFGTEALGVEMLEIIAATPPTKMYEGMDSIQSIQHYLTHLPDRNSIYLDDHSVDRDVRLGGTQHLIPHYQCYYEDNAKTAARALAKMSKRMTYEKKIQREIDQLDKILSKEEKAYVRLEIKAVKTQLTTALEKREKKKKQKAKELGVSRRFVQLDKKVKNEYVQAFCTRPVEKKSQHYTLPDPFLDRDEFLKVFNRITAGMGKKKLHDKQDEEDEEKDDETSDHEEEGETSSSDSDFISISSRLKVVKHVQKSFEEPVGATILREMEMPVFGILRKPNIIGPPITTGSMYSTAMNLVGGASSSELANTLRPSLTQIYGNAMLIHASQVSEMLANSRGTSAADIAYRLASEVCALSMITTAAPTLSSNQVHALEDDPPACVEYWPLANQHVPILAPGTVNAMVITIRQAINLIGNYSVAVPGWGVEHWGEQGEEGVAVVPITNAMAGNLELAAWCAGFMEYPFRSLEYNTTIYDASQGLLNSDAAVIPTNHLVRCSGPTNQILFVIVDDFTNVGRTVTIGGLDVTMAANCAVDPAGVPVDVVNAFLTLGASTTAFPWENALRWWRMVFGNPQDATTAKMMLNETYGFSLPLPAVIANGLGVHWAFCHSYDWNYIVPGDTTQISDTSLEKMSGCWTTASGSLCRELSEIRNGFTHYKMAAHQPVVMLGIASRLYSYTNKLSMQTPILPIFRAPLSDMCSKFNIAYTLAADYCSQALSANVLGFLAYGSQANPGSDAGMIKLCQRKISDLIGHSVLNDNVELTWLGNIAGNISVEWMCNGMGELMTLNRMHSAWIDLWFGRQLFTLNGDTISLLGMKWNAKNEKCLAIGVIPEIQRLLDVTDVNGPLGLRLDSLSTHRVRQLMKGANAIVAGVPPAHNLMLVWDSGEAQYAPVIHQRYSSSIGATFTYAALAAGIGIPHGETSWYSSPTLPSMFNTHWQNKIASIGTFDAKFLWHGPGNPWTLDPTRRVGVLPKGSPDFDSAVVSQSYLQELSSLV
jgi:hypothetical protein